MRDAARRRGADGAAGLCRPRTLRALEHVLRAQYLFLAAPGHQLFRAGRGADSTAPLVVAGSRGTVLPVMAGAAAAGESRVWRTLVSLAAAGAGYRIVRGCAALGVGRFQVRLLHAAGPRRRVA